MIHRSRPLRFVVIVVGGWIAVRVVMLWPADATDPIISTRGAFSPVRHYPDRHAGLDPASSATSGVACYSGCRVKPGMTVRLQKAALGDRATPFSNLRAIGSTFAPPAAILPVDFNVPPKIEPSPAIVSTLSPNPIGPPAPSRWSGSAWLIARGGGGAAVPFAPQLGGSQAGARITYALGASRRVALAARVSTALAMTQREAAIGLDWRPAALPVHFFAEQRIAIDGARGGPAAGVIAGLPPTRLPAGFALEGYGQTGAIARAGGEGFVDAAARAMRPIATRGNARVELGAGLWGGAQRGAARLDAGPAANLILPVARPVRLSLEWRQRIAGGARPGSGLALSLGADF